MAPENTQQYEKKVSRRKLEGGRFEPGFKF